MGDKTETSQKFPERELLGLAQQHLYNICADPKAFRMSVPPNAYDTDLIFQSVIDLAHELLTSRDVTHCEPTHCMIGIEITEGGAESLYDDERDRTFMERYPGNCLRFNFCPECGRKYER